MFFALKSIREIFAFSRNGKSSHIPRDVRHHHTDALPGVHGRAESTSLLVDVPIHDDRYEDLRLGIEK